MNYDETNNITSEDLFFEWLLKTDDMKVLSDFAEGEDIESRSYVAMNRTVPDELQAKLLQDREVAQAVAKNPDAPQELLVRLAKSTDEGLRVRVAGNQRSPVEVLAELAWWDNDRDVRETAAKNLNNVANSEVLSKLWELRPGTKCLDYILSCKACTPELLNVIYHDIEDRYEEQLCLSEELDKLLKDSRCPENVIRDVFFVHAINKGFEIGKNPNTPAEILVELAKDEDNEVRKVVAMNPNTPAEVLAELAKDKDDGVRIEVAKNRNTPVETLAELAKFIGFAKQAEMKEYFLNEMNVKEIYPFRDGWALFRQSDGKMNYVNPEGNTFFRDGVDKAKEFKDGLTQVMNNGEVFTYNSQRQEVSLEMNQGMKMGR